MKKTYRGTVIGLNNLKTAVVKIIRNEIHEKYSKPIKKETKVYAHNEIDLEIGDKVLIESSRPYSATKRFLVLKKE